MGIIYCIRNKIDGKCYIGQTTNSFDRRYHGGKWWKYTANQHLIHAVDKYGRENFDVEILVDNINNVDELNTLEIEYAIKLNSYHPDGYNFRGCGDNHFLFKETIEKIRDKNSKPLRCSNGKTYKSQQEAAKDLKITQGGIAMFFMGRIKHVKGYTFSNLDEVPPPLPPDYDPEYGKPIAIYCSNGKTYKSVNSAACDLGFDDWSIFQHLNGRRRAVKGLVFAKVGDPLPDKNRKVKSDPKRVIRLEDGKIWDSVSHCSKDLGIERCTIRGHCKRLTTYKKNQTFRFME